MTVPGAGPRTVRDECDIVMKGGLASGLVYSSAVPVLAGRYRLRSIGGTSAGAVAAVLATAAELRRARSAGGQDQTGFDQLSDEGARLAGRPKDFARLFQPDAFVPRVLFRWALKPRRRTIALLSAVLLVAGMIVVPGVAVVTGSAGAALAVSIAAFVLAAGVAVAAGYALGCTAGCRGWDTGSVGARR